MSLYRRGKTWHFDFQINGYRFSGPTGLADKRHAEEFEAAEKAKARADVEQFIITNASPLTIERACARWWREHGSTLNDPALEQRLAWLVATLGPRTPLHAISNDMVSRLVQLRRRDVRKSGRDGATQLYRPITATTVNKSTVVLLRRVMRYARDNWDAAIVNEPTWKKHLLKETRRGVRELSAAEDAILDAAEPADYAILRRFAEITGLRRGNLLLTWSQVDFDQAVIRIISKGGVPRVLPLTKEAYAILWSRRGHHPEFVFTYVCQKSRKIPKGVDRERHKGLRYPITYTGMGSNKRNWKRAGVDARIHDLRHTAAMRILRTTGNLKMVQKVLGHSDIAITAKFYTDATIEDQREAMERTASAAPAPLLLEHKKTDSET